MDDRSKCLFESNPVKIELDEDSGVIRMYNPDIDPDKEIPVEIFPDVLPAVLEVLQHLAEKRMG